MDNFIDIRLPAVADQFYPGSRKRLEATVRAALSEADPATADGTVRALLVPHAGYTFSGVTAGKAYGLLNRASEQYDRIVLLSPSHTVPFSAISMGPYKAYRTPIGEMRVDREVCRELADISPLFNLQAEAHAHEHALEVQLPFLQILMPHASLVPAICGQLDERKLQAAAEVLSGYLWDPRSLWVISSDFTHYGSAFGYLPFTENIPDKLRELDFGAIDRIRNLDAAGFLDYCVRTGSTICGSIPIAILLYALRECKENILARIIDYHRSGEQTGDYAHCVSYVSMVFTTS